MAPQLSLALERGIEAHRALDVIEALHIDPPKNAPDRWPWPVRIFTLGRFEVRVGDQALEYSRKVPRKTLHLLKVLVVHGGRDVPEDALCDALWSDEEGDAAVNALAVTVVRLRKLLGRSDAVTHQGGVVSLNSALCWVDVWTFEKRITDAFGTPPAIDLYERAFLPEEEGEAWSVTMRERVRDKFIRALSLRGAELEEKGNIEQALACYRRGIDADPIVEGFYTGVMRCYEQLDQRSQALSIYCRLKQTLSVVLGVPPSESSRRLFEEMVCRQSEAAGSIDVAQGACGANAVPPLTPGTSIKVRRRSSRGPSKK